MQEISIKDILAILKKNLVWLIIIPVVTAAAAWFYFRLQPNEYTASTKLYVLMDYTDSTGQIHYDSSTSAQFAGDFKELITTPNVLVETAKQLGGDVEMFKDMTIDISSVSGTRILAVDVTTTTPELSLKVSNTISNVFVAYIRQIMKTDTVSVAAEATMPEVPSGPARLRNTLLAYIVAMVAVVGILLAIKMLDSTLHTSEEIEQTLELPVLASIGDYKAEIGRFLDKERERIPLSDVVSGATQENLKTLATNVQFATMGNHMRSLMITSCMSTEGKSTLALMLAESLADEGFKVLVCDMDVRRPSIGRYVGVRNRMDIFDYMTGKAGLREIVVRTAKKNVFFMDCRHQINNASQIVNYPKFDDFLKAVYSNFDYVLFDTSPLGMFIDAAVLSKKIDGTLLVVGTGMVERALAQEVVGQLRKADANIIGVALNYVDKGKNSYYYGKYGYDTYGYGNTNRSKQSSKSVKSSKAASSSNAGESAGARQSMNGFVPEGSDPRVDSKEPQPSGKEV
ncbi:MAG: polysaccharide biosynthesis tyrosine autokinase [Clostridia bacterium]